jgi:hydroxymethylpyrimidine kinase / phosphomethylpyrimidine kinase / thiamine-phosphate diphosphorylase
VTTAPTSRPILWSIAGLDTAGGAGLSADQRAADAMGVHLCPVIAAMTAQHSQGVDAVMPVPEASLRAQLQALTEDLPPRAIKTGLLGSVAAVRLVAHWVDHFRAQAPAGTDPHRHLALVVDPVLGASAGGRSFADAAVRDAMRAWLLPRATVLTPNRAEARALLNLAGGHGGPREEVPALATALRALGVRSVVITGGDAPDDIAHSTGSGWCLDWLDTPQAQGWLCAPRLPAPHHHGSGCTFASGVASAWALGHLDADAVVLAHMLTRHALAHGHVAGRGVGPVKATSGFAAGVAQGGAALPWLGLGTDLPWRLQPALGTDHAHTGAPLFAPFTPPTDGLYGILPNHPQLKAALDAGVRCVQLRHKPTAGLQAQLDASLADTARVGAQLFVNDHWRAALTLPPRMAVEPGFRLGVHLGQEDLQALDADDRARLRAERGRIMLGLSSHSLWELSRAVGCGASLIACGPVQPTTTKDMPWRPQGEDNLRWWLAHSPVPIVAIGGLLTPADLRRHAACGPHALCVVRALGPDAQAMQHTVPALRMAVHTGRGDAGADRDAALSLPHPVL